MQLEDKGRDRYHRSTFKSQGDTLAATWTLAVLRAVARTSNGVCLWLPAEELQVTPVAVFCGAQNSNKKL